jgi:hypothetical protein
MNPNRDSARPGRVWLWVPLALILLIALRSAAGYIVEYQWWREMGQVDTWLSMLSFAVLPGIAGLLLAYCVIWVAHARGMKTAGASLRDHRAYSVLSSLVLLAPAVIATLPVWADRWVLLRYLGSTGARESGWRDPVFGQSLNFYFFTLPAWRMALGFLLGVLILQAIVFLLSNRGWSVVRRGMAWSSDGQMGLDIADLELGGALQSVWLRVSAALVLLVLGLSFWLDRYDLLFEEHESLVGIEWTAEHVVLPLILVKSAACVLASAGVIAGRFWLVLAVPLVWIVGIFLPGIVHSTYVRPSEITIQRPYIERHIAATRAAFGLDRRSREIEFKARIEGTVDLKKHQPLLDNVRLWDWRAFHDTVTQIQALRPYYVFADSDVDRYTINGQLRQVLLTPRELDVNQLPAEARSRWINPHFVYTHGYGLVVAEAARITSDGLPHLLVQDAPPTVRTEALKLTRPEIYYGEVTHEPVFVRTQQPEFNYPSGSGNVESRYDGKGGFPISSIMLRLAAAVSTGDWNILLTSYLTPESRMMVRRKVRDRLESLAGFLDWDRDPYLVVSREGRLVWIVDGFTSSVSHPYARSLRVGEIGRLNYLRNSVKATVDAYDGTVTIYVFDDDDPLISAWRSLFPSLFRDVAAMPQDLREHARYPETMFRVQAEIYRVFHMTDPEAFFNKEDQWDLARNINSGSGRPDAVAPTYIVATLPGSDAPEFLLITTFTPRNKDNLIGLMLARCDGPNLGELIFLQLSKQELIFGPMQIEARINQDQNISKDLTLWNQQGSQVLRGQMLVLPVDDTLLYFEPIYIQASEARMPQLKKIALAMGNRLVYSDSYEQAIAELTGGQRFTVASSAAPAAVQPTGAVPAASRPTSDVVDEIRSHLRRYRELLSQGKYSEAGREMERIEQLAGK